MPLQLATLLQQNIIFFGDSKQIQLLLSSPFTALIVTAVDLSDVPICPRR
jgi:hypothetical protein